MTGEAYREIRTCQVRATDLKVGDVFDTRSGETCGDYAQWVEITNVGKDDGGGRWVEFAIPKSIAGSEQKITWRPLRFELVTIQWSYQP